MRMDPNATIPERRRTFKFFVLAAFIACVAVGIGSLTYYVKFLDVPDVSTQAHDGTWKATDSTSRPLIPNSVKASIIPTARTTCAASIHKGISPTPISSSLPQVSGTTHAPSLPNRDLNLNSGHVTAPIKKKTDLFTATKDIGNWKGFCEHLDISEVVMNELQFSQKADIIKKEDCLTDYYNNHDPDWFTVARVIANHPISNLRIACQIAEDYMGIHKSDCKRFLTTESSSKIVKGKNNPRLKDPEFYSEKKVGVLMNSVGSVPVLNQAIINEIVSSNEKIKMEIKTLANMIVVGQRHETKILELIMSRTKHSTLKFYSLMIDQQDEAGFSPLMLSCLSGIADFVEVLLENGAKINLQSKDGVSSLMIASIFGHIDIVKLLLENGANVDIMDSYGYTPLMFASSRGHLDLAEILLEHNATVDLKNDDGSFSLMIASIGGQSDLIKVLLKYGASIDLMNKHGISSLIATSALRKVNVVQLLLEYGANINLKSDGGVYPLIAASIRGHVDMVKIILRNGAMVNIAESSVTSLMIASVNGYMDTAKVLLEFGANPDLMSDSGSSSLLLAISMGHSDFVKLMLKNGANVDQMDRRGYTPLMLASVSGNTDRAVILLEFDANPDLKNNDGDFSLLIAISKGHVDFVKLLLENGATIDLQNKDGLSPLSTALALENTDIVILLLKNSADVDLRHQHGYTPLMMTCERGNTDMAKILLEFDANPDLKNNDGGFSLLIAISKGHVDFVKLLLENAANPDLMNSNGLFPLWMASNRGHTDIVELLLENSATIDLQNKVGSSALSTALLQDNMDMVTLLLNNGANVDLISVNGITPLMLAIKYKAYFVKLLIENGASVDIRNKVGYSALFIASCFGNTNIVNTLIENGANINIQDNSGIPPLFCAINYIHTDIFNLLLKKHANVNIQTENGLSPLSIAIETGNTDMLKVLLENGAEVDLQDMDGLSPLMKCGNGNVDAARLLIKHGADVNLIDMHGDSSLMHACNCNNGLQGDVDIVKILLEKEDINIDLQNNDGWSSLMIACHYGHMEIANELLSKFADIYLRNWEGKTAFDIAVDCNQLDIVPLFTRLRENPSFPGMLFSEGIKRQLVTSKKVDVDRLRESGISLSFPKNSLLPSDSPLEVHIQPCYNLPFEINGDIESVSPAYIVKPSRNVNFIKDIITKIHHFAKLQTDADYKDMVFLTTSSTPEFKEFSSNPIYVFKEIERASFFFKPNEESPVGQISLKHFCILMVGKKRNKNVNKHLYSAMLYKAENRAIFCVCVYNPQYLQLSNRVMASEYQARKAPTQKALTLSSDYVSIKESSDTKDWNVLPDVEPARISRIEIEQELLYINQTEELLNMNFPPRIVIKCEPTTLNPKPLKLNVKGLSNNFSFNLQPDDLSPPKKYYTDILSKEVLNEDHHFEINQFLKTLDESHIIVVGEALGLVRHKLKKMKDLPGDMVAAWLRREDNVIKISGNPTWISLVNALVKVGQIGIASDIMQAHPSSSSSY